MPTKNPDGTEIVPTPASVRASALVPSGMTVPPGWGATWERALQAAQQGTHQPLHNTLLAGIPGPAVIGYVGDSISHGYGSMEPLVGGWCGRTTKKLQAAYGHGGSGLHRVVDSSKVLPLPGAGGAGTFSTVSTFTTPANATYFNNIGRFGCCVGLNPGNIWTIPKQRGRDLIVCWQRGNGVGDTRVRVDGVQVGADIVGAGVLSNQMTHFDLGAAFADKEYTVTLEPINAGIVIDGIICANRSGVMGLNMAISGANSAWGNIVSVTGGGGSNVAGIQGLGSYRLDAAVIAMGFNDRGIQLALDTYETNMDFLATCTSYTKSLVFGEVTDLIIAQSPSVSAHDTGKAIPYREYIARMRKIANQRDAVWWNQLRVTHDGAPYENIGSFRGYYGASDSAHPLDIGYERLSVPITDLLTL